MPLQGTLTVRRQLVVEDPGSRVRVKPPKSHNGVRTLVLDARTLDLLGPVAAGPASRYLFAGRTGQPIRPDNLTDRFNSLTRERALKIASLLARVRAEAWAVVLRDWDRSLRAGNDPESTRYNSALAVSQLAAYLDERAPETDAASDPILADSRQVVAFQAWVIETRSASTGLNKYKALQQFFGWLVAEGEIERSPMLNVPKPTAVQRAGRGPQRRGDPANP